MVAIIRRNPSRALTMVEPVRPLSILDEVEMLTRDLWEDWRPYSFRTGEILPMDMYEQKDELVVRLELPGFKKEDIAIRIEGDLLTIQAERKPEELTEDTTSYVCERSFGRYSRAVTLPFPVEANKISTTFENGLLEMTLPKAAKVKAKHIEIKVGASKASASKSK